MYGDINITRWNIVRRTIILNTENTNGHTVDSPPSGDGAENTREKKSSLLCILLGEYSCSLYHEFSPFTLLPKSIAYPNYTSLFTLFPVIVQLICSF